MLLLVRLCGDRCCTVTYCYRAPRTRGVCSDGIHTWMLFGVQKMHDALCLLDTCAFCVRRTSSSDHTLQRLRMKLGNEHLILCVEGPLQGIIRLFPVLTEILQSDRDHSVGVKGGHFFELVKTETHLSFERFWTKAVKIDGTHRFWTKPVKKMVVICHGFL